MIAESDRLVEKLRREIGACTLSALDDPDVVEIMLNPDGKLWVEANGQLALAMERYPNSTDAILDPLRARSVINTLAGLSGVTINTESPLLECALTSLNGERVLAAVPPVVSHPSLVIRKHNPAVIPLSAWVEQGAISESDATLLEGAIEERKNLLIAGGTGSGKTTFANTLLEVMREQDADQRVLLIEDTAELQCSLPNTIAFQTSLEVDMLQLLRAALRARPDRIIVGEVRGGEAWTLLKSWLTGHPGGLCTIHATSAKQAHLRMVQMCAETTTPIHIVEETVREAIDWVVQITRKRDQRMIELLDTKG